MLIVGWLSRRLWTVYVVKAQKWMRVVFLGHTCTLYTNVIVAQRAAGATNL